MGRETRSQSLRGQNNTKTRKGSPNKELPAEEARLVYSLNKW